MNGHDATNAGGTGRTVPSPGTAPSTTATADEARSDAMCAQLAQNWWAVAMRGVFAILFGLVALFLTGPTLLSLVLFFSAYMLVDGIVGIVAAVRAARGGERWGMLIFEGVLNIAVGVIAFVMPGLTVIAFVLLLGAWSLVSGALMLGAAFRLSQRHGRWWMALAGISSIVLGILLAIAPLMGAVVLTWWVGAYALVFGIALLVLAFRLRARKDEGPPLAAPRAA